MTAIDSINILCGNSFPYVKNKHAVIIRYIETPENAALAKQKCSDFMSTETLGLCFLQPLEFLSGLFPLIYGIMQALEQDDGFVQCSLAIKFDSEHAFLKIPVVYDANIFDGDICLGKQRGE